MFWINLMIFFINSKMKNFMTRIIILIEIYYILYGKWIFIYLFIISTFVKLVYILCKVFVKLTETDFNEIWIKFTYVCTLFKDELLDTDWFNWLIELSNQSVSSVTYAEYSFMFLFFVKTVLWVWGVLSAISECFADWYYWFSTVDSVIISQVKLCITDLLDYLLLQGSFDYLGPAGDDSYIHSLVNLSEQTGTGAGNTARPRGYIWSNDIWSNPVDTDMGSRAENRGTQSVDTRLGNNRQNSSIYDPNKSCLEYLHEHYFGVAFTNRGTFPLNSSVLEEFHPNTAKDAIIEDIVKYQSTTNNQIIIKICNQAIHFVKEGGPIRGINNPYWWNVENTRLTDQENTVLRDITAN